MPQRDVARHITTAPRWRVQHAVRKSPRPAEIAKGIAQPAVLSLQASRLDLLAPRFPQ
jgi:hypothetical protein